VAKHAVKHRKRKKSARGAIKASAVSMAGLLTGGLVLAPQPHMAASAMRTVIEDVLLAAGTIIFIDGNNYPYGSQRMAGELDAGSPGGTYDGYKIGQYQPPPLGCTAPCTPLNAPMTPPATTFVFINTASQYPGTLGLYNGLGAPSGDTSIADGQAAIAQDIIAADPGSANPVTVVGYSEGAVAASNLVPNYQPSSNVNFVLIGDPENPDGGILARLPIGTYIPLLGITADGPTSSSGAPVVIVTQEYDGIADAPAYPLNVVADANAVLGFYYVHGDYEDVNPNASTNIVTTSGNLTEILVPAAPGALPLEMPLAQAGVPQPILVALDPALRAIINTGYPPSSPDVAGKAGDPAQQVEFALLPPASALPGDAQAVVVGFVTTAQLLPGALVASVPGGSSLPAPFVLSTPPVKIGEALAEMPGAIQLGDNNFLTGAGPADTAWTPLSSPVFSSASVPQQQSILAGAANVGADSAPASQTPPSTNPPADSPGSPAPSITGPVTGALANAVTNLSPFAIAGRLSPTGTPGITNPGSGTANTTNSPGENLANNVNGAVTGLTGAVGNVLGGLRSLASGDGQHSH